MQRLLLLAVLTKRHNAVELLVVVTTRFTAKLVDFILETRQNVYLSVCAEFVFMNLHRVTIIFKEKLYNNILLLHHIPHRMLVFRFVIVVNIIFLMVWLLCHLWRSPPTPEFQASN